MSMKWRAIAARPYAAVAPHRSFLNLSKRAVLRVARIPSVRILLQRKWPIWGKLLVKNKMRAEVGGGIYCLTHHPPLFRTSSSCDSASRL